MKGAGRPRNLKQIFAHTLAALIGENNNAAYSHPNTGTMAYKTSWNPGKFKSIAGSKKNSPGRKRRLGANAFMTPAPSNPDRRATKTLNGTIFHRPFPRGSSMGAVPTMDQTAALAKRIGCKIIVSSGKCYVRTLGNILGRGPIPINCTRDTFMKKIGITVTTMDRA